MRENRTIIYEEVSQMKIGIGSKNPAKIRAVEQLKGIPPSRTLLAIDAPSGVSQQPFSDDETVAGAINRAEYCVNEKDVDIGIGLEGGVTETSYGLMVCNWGALIARKKEPIIAGGARFLLPKEIAEEVRKGKELGPLMDQFTNKYDVRKREGAVGIFTNGLITRDEMFSHVLNILFGQYQYMANRD